MKVTEFELSETTTNSFQPIRRELTVVPLVAYWFAPSFL